MEMRVLRADQQRKHAVLVDQGDAALRLEIGVFDGLVGVDALEDYVGLGECRVHVADRIGQVGDEIAVRVQKRRALLYRILGRQDRLERFVFDLHERGRGIGDFQRVGRNRDNRLADMADDVLGEDRSVLEQRADLQPLVGNVRGGENATDAGQRCGLRDVDALDARIGIGAAHEAAVKHIGKSDVRGVFRLAADLVEHVVARDASADIAATRFAIEALDQRAIGFLPGTLLAFGAQGKFLAFVDLRHAVLVRSASLIVRHYYAHVRRLQGL